MRTIQLPGLNILRVLASLYMVIFHLHPSSVPGPVAVFFSRGTSDTSLFFILSGFLLAHLYADVKMDDPAQQRFVWRRIARIFPANVIGLLFLLGTQALQGSVVVDWNTLSECLLLVQTWVVGNEHAMNVPAWSMSCLLFFYLIFPVILPRLVRLKTATLQVGLLGLWILGAVVLPELARWPWGFDPSDWTQHLHTSPLLRSAEFVLGMGVAVLVARQGRPPVWWFRCTVPVILALMFFAPGETMAVNNGLFAPFTVSLLVAFVTPGPLLERLGNSGPVRTLASASICIFLLHVTWINLFKGWVLPHLHLEWNLWTLGLFLTLVLTSSVLVDRFICQPLSRLLTRPVLRPVQPTTTPAPALTLVVQPARR